MSKDMEQYLKKIMFRYCISQGITPYEIGQKLKLQKDEMQEFMLEFSLN